MRESMNSAVNYSWSAVLGVCFVHFGVPASFATAFAVTYGILTPASWLGFRRDMRDSALLRVYIPFQTSLEEGIRTQRGKSSSET